MGFLLPASLVLADTAWAGVDLDTRTGFEGAADGALEAEALTPAETAAASTLTSFAVDLGAEEATCFGFVAFVERGADSAGLFTGACLVFCKRESRELVDGLVFSAIK